MKKLQTGFISSQEIADWFGLAYGSFKNKRQARLLELREYCTYTQVRGGVEIIKIFYDTYEGDLSKKDIQTAVKYVKEQQKIQKTDKPWLTGAMMAKDLADRGNPGYCNITEESGSNKACRALKKAYGETGYLKEGKQAPIPGPFGRRYWVWATKDYSENQYLPLSEEEWEVFDKVFHLTNSKEDKEMRRVETMIKQDYAEGKITKEQFADQMTEVQIVNFKNALNSFKHLTGKTLVHCQEYELNIPGVF